MPMSRELKIGLGALLLAGILIYVSSLLGNYPGAREAPSKSEAAIARRLRSWSMPRDARSRKNPFTNSPELLQKSARHFADHCASCHGNDGSGATEMGRNLFPRAPDMRLDSTQRLSDGELYYIIHNGVRWTGMPAWGDADNDRTAGSSCSSSGTCLISLRTKSGIWSITTRRASSSRKKKKKKTNSSMAAPHPRRLPPANHTRRKQDEETHVDSDTHAVCEHAGLRSRQPGARSRNGGRGH